VPAHDSRDYAFARFFSLDIVEVVKGGDISTEAFEGWEGVLVNSDFLDGLDVKNAIRNAIDMIAAKGYGEEKVNYRLRDAVFGRQRYWGEPIPIFYKDDIPYPLPETELPLILPEVDKFLPTDTGEPPLARAKNWKYKGIYEYEHTTMPGWAGSSWYYLRYMDAGNTNEFASEAALDYWKNVDLYLGGSEHATGHLLYVRFWTKLLYDLGHIKITEPAQKLLNQGMIQGISCFVYRINGSNTFVSEGLKKQYETTALRVDVNMVNNNVLDINAFRNWLDDYRDAEFILEDGKYVCGTEVEKMSKSKWNVVNPDLIIDSYGADCLRLYEMFLGPIEQSKPWNTHGITGVSGFLRKFWKLFFRNGNFELSSERATLEELRILHKTIKKISEDIERFSFNTSVSAFMICVNELTDLGCNKKEVLEPLVILLSSFAPHITEELWAKIGHRESIISAQFPIFNEDYIAAEDFEYPVSINGKTRFKLKIPLNLTREQIEEKVITAGEMKKYLDGNTPKKIIVVPGRIVNIVI
jgi:leucyl-tRNA synthetase